MCLAYRIKHSNSSPLGATSFFVPCGKCEECRAAVKNAWAFRLRSEIEYKLKLDYKCVFFTLTYSDYSLPRLGWECFNADYMQQFQLAVEHLGTEKELPSDARLISSTRSISQLPCFSRDDVENFVKDLKNWLYRTYKLTNVSYFGASEFGSSTKRPHYHFLIILPKDVDFRELHKQIKNHWTNKGHVFPRYFEGGVDSHGYHHKPFVVASPHSAARYCAKYATKDLYYSEFLVEHGLTDQVVDIHSREFKRKMVFHVQTKSLGACVLRGLTDEQKIRMYTTGHAFVSDDKLSPIPVYIKNKLIYDNYYIWEAHTLLSPKNKGCKELGVLSLQEDYTFKRLVRRKANEFFANNSKQIYAYKVKTYTEFFKRFLDKSMYERRGISPEFVHDGVDLMSWLCTQCSFEEMAETYLLYDGVPRENWRVVAPEDRHLLYLARYLEHPNYDDFQKFSSDSVQSILRVLGMVIQCYYISPLSRTEAKKLQDRISDFFKSVTNKLIA